MGKNGNGQIGDGTTDNKLTPTKITLANGIKPKQIASGSYHTLAIGDDGNLYTWGENYRGQLGDGTNNSNPTPKKITLASGVKPTQIACGESYSMAIGSDGNLYTWGNGGFGQLGIEYTMYESHSKSIPTKITLSNEIKPTQIACGAFHSIAIGNDGELYTWGNNQDGQLGDGTTAQRNIPTKIILESGVKPTQIACGYFHSIAIGDNKSIYTWGWNNFGQLGDGTTDNKLIPTKITLPNGAKSTQISCGYFHSIVTDNNGNICAWGMNGYGQLGEGLSSMGENTPTLLRYDFNQ